MADTLVETNISSTLDWRTALWGPYWSDEDVGVIVYVDISSDLRFTRTIDKGNTWADTLIYTGTVQQIACRYDKETPGNAGTLVHIAWINNATDSVFYRTVDVSDGSLGAERTVDSGVNVSSTPYQHRVAITQTVSGNIILAFSTQSEIECYKSTDNFATGLGVGQTKIDDVFETATQEDWCLLFSAATADNDDACAVFWDRSANEVSLKVYDDSGDTWTEKSIAGPGIGVYMYDDNYHINMDGAIRHSDGHVLVAAHTNDDNGNDYLRTWDLTVDDPDAANCTVTAKAHVFANQGESAQVAVFINQQDDDVYVAYLKGNPTWQSTVDVVYHKSEDGMGTWGAEQAYSEGGPDDFRLVHAGRTAGVAGGRYQPAFYNDDTLRIYVNETNDIEIASGAPPAVISSRRLLSGTGR